MKLHIIAISGTATASLAAILLEKGFKISGSDRNFYPPMGDFVKSLPVKLSEGFSRENIDKNHPLDGVIAGNLVSSSNPEVERAIELGLEIYSLPEALYHFAMKNKKRIVVAGTHGKTTTSSLLAWSMEVAGLNPGFLIGGMPLNFGRSGRAGKKWFIVEGDEYETSFFDKGPKFSHYFPNYLILGPVEMDHYDIYENLEDIKKSFSLLVSLVPSSGLIISYNNPVNREILEKARAEVVLYPTAELHYETLKNTENFLSFNLKIKDDYIKNLRSEVASSTIAINSLPVAYLLYHLGFGPKIIKKTINSFKGIKRRMESILKGKNFYFFTDFAHHPTSLRLNLKDLRSRFQDWKIISILEPASWSMRSNVFEKDLPEALSSADFIILAPPPKGALKKGIPLNRKNVCEALKKMGKNCVHPESWEEIYEILNELPEDNNVIVLFSNGNIDEKVGRIKDILKSH